MRYFLSITQITNNFSKPQSDLSGRVHIWYTGINLENEWRRQKICQMCSCFPQGEFVFCFCRLVAKVVMDIHPPDAVCRNIAWLPNRSRQSVTCASFLIYVPKPFFFNLLMHYDL